MTAPYDYICRLLAGDTSSNPNGKDWQRFVSLADAHGVAPLLHYTLTRQHVTHNLPEHVQHSLRNEYYTSTAQQALLLSELNRISHVVKSPMILLKGAALATTLYPEPATRPLSDLDFLIPRPALDDAVAAVRALGYSEHAPEIGAGMHQAASYHVHLRGGPGGNLMVELHWNLVGSDDDRYAPNLDWFWEQTEAWEQGSGSGRERERAGDGMQNSATVLQLTPTAHLLFLAAHLVLQHGASHARLLWFYDLHLLLTKAGDRIEWETLIQKAGEFHWAPALYAGLRGTQARLGTPLPEAEMAALAEIVEQDPLAAILVERQSIADQTRVMRARSKLSGMSWRSRFRYVRNQVLPQRDYIRWRYEPEPAWLWVLYYPYRWWDILRDGLRTVVRMMRIRSNHPDR